MAPRKTSPKTAKPDGDENAKADETPAEAPAATETAKAAEDAAAENKAEDEAAEKKAEEGAAKAQNSEPETRPHKLLCHVRMHGEVIKPGDEVTMTRAEFDHLKRNQAVTGEFDG